MRNLILSAFPRAMRLPDPFTPQLKVDQLPEMLEAPNVQLPDWDAALGAPLRSDVEAFLAKALTADASKAFLQVRTLDFKPFCSKIYVVHCCRICPEQVAVHAL